MIAVNPDESQISLRGLVSLKEISFCIEDFEPGWALGKYYPVQAISEIFATISDDSPLMNLEVATKLTKDPLRSLRWLLDQTSWVNLDDAINSWQERAKVLTRLTMRLEYRKQDMNSEDVASLLQEYERIRVDKLPLTNSNTLINVSILSS